VTDGVVTKYYYAGAQRIAMRTNGILNFILGDHLGSTSLVTDANGVMVSETRYKAWGEERYSSGTKQTKYGYTGQYSYAADFGLEFFNARWYDSSLSRFAQADTIMPGGVQGWDRYAYTANNPVRYVDPTGHITCTDDGYCGSLNSASYWNRVIKDLSFSYGITFSGKWKQEDKLAALTGAVVVAGALSKRSGLSSEDTFSAVFGELTLSATEGSGNKWECQRSASPSGVSCTSGKLGLEPRLMAHEFAHVFNAMYANGGHENSPYDVLGDTTITDSAGNWITGMTYDPIEGVNEWTRGYDGYQQVNGLYDDPSLYHGPVDWGTGNANSVSEEFADMFLNWAYNSFDSSPAGSARYSWMSGEVSRALSVMLP